MPTARELLEQADALMRRNRAPGPSAAGEVAEAPPIPELTEVAADVVAAGVAAAEDAAEDAAPPPATGDDAPPAREALAREVPAGVLPAAAETRAAADLVLDDIPELTEAIEEIEAPSIIEPGSEFEFGEPSVFLGAEHGEASLFGPWPPAADASDATADGGDVAGPDAAVADTGVLYVAPELLDEALLQQLPADALVAAVPEPTPPAAAATTAAVAPLAAPAPYVLLLRPSGPELPAPEPPAAPAPAAVAVTAAPDPAADGARWATLAEEIRMQVLQRIDIFTDTGLQEQLTQRLQPIVDRASADLVATINQHLGQLLRAYVAEAIEREIEKWRAGDR